MNKQIFLNCDFFKDERRLGEFYSQCPPNSRGKRLEIYFRSFNERQVQQIEKKGRNKRKEAGEIHDPVKIDIVYK